MNSVQVTTALVRHGWTSEKHIDGITSKRMVIHGAKGNREFAALWAQARTYSPWIFQWAILDRENISSFSELERKLQNV